MIHDKFHIQADFSGEASIVIRLGVDDVRGEGGYRGSASGAGAGVTMTQHLRGEALARRWRGAARRGAERSGICRYIVLRY
jgi:hypothetical protein